MGEVRDPNIKNRTYYYLNNIIDIKKFEPSLIKIDKKLHRDFDIYYIGYITIKKFSSYENIRSVNPLCLIFHSATGYFKEEYGEKYLILDLIEKHEEAFYGILSEIKTINGGKKLFYEKNYARISANTDDDVPLNKQRKFPTLTIIIRCVFQKGEELDPLIYLDECLYEL